MDNVIVRFKLTPRAQQLRAEHRIDPSPQRKSDGAACYDLMAVEAAFITANDKPTLIPTGLILEIPYGYEGIVRGRSGLAKDGRIVTWGTVDADFRGEVLVNMMAIGLAFGGGFAVEVGMRIAQLAIRPVTHVHFTEAKDSEPLTPTIRGEGGWGSTGLK